MKVKARLTLAALALFAGSILALGLQAQERNNLQDKDKITESEQQLMRQFNDFQNLLLQLKNRLARGTPEERRRAEDLDKVLEMCRDLAVNQEFAKMLELLTRAKATTNDYEDLKNQSDTIASKLRRILEAMQAGRGDRLSKDIQDLKDIVKRLQAAIDAQANAQALNNLGKTGQKELQKYQDNASKKASDVGDKIKDFLDRDKKGGQGGEGKPTKGENKEGKGDGAKGEAKGEGKAGEGAKGETKDAGKSGEGAKGETKPGQQGGDKGDPKSASKSGEKGAEAAGAKGDKSGGKGGEGDAKGKGQDAKGGESGAKGKGQDSKAGEGAAKGDEKGGAGEKGNKPDANAKPGQPGPSDAKPGAKDSKAGDKAGGDSKAGGDPKSGQGGEGAKGDAKSGDAKSGDAKGGGQPPMGGGQPPPGGQAKGGDSPPGGSPPPGGNKQDDDIAKSQKRIQEAGYDQKIAEEKLKEKDPKNAAPNQGDAKTKLEEAKKNLEKLLNQMREEEIERVLAQLQARCEKMLIMQMQVLAGTEDTDKLVQKNADKKPNTDNKKASLKLADTEKEIVQEVNKCIDILESEGSAVAFPEVFQQVRQDMIHVQKRLEISDVGDLTQTIEKDIIASLKEMIEALKKAREDNQDPSNKPGQPGKAGKPGDQKLLELLQELKMVRALQKRVNDRTVDYSRRFPGQEQTADPQIVRELRNLAERQMRIQGIVEKIAKGDNK